LSAARRLSFRDYDAIVTQAAERTGDPAFGLRAADCWHPSHAGALGGAILASPTMRSAFRRLERFSQVCHDHFKIEVEELSDRVRVDYHALVEPARPSIVGDARVAILFRMCEFNLGRRPRPVEVCLSRRRPEDPAPWNDFFGVEVKFDQAQNGLAISNDDADATLTSGDSELISIHEEILRRQLVRLDRQNILFRARQAIIEHLPTGRVTEERLARKLNMSKRTLHRKLRENDETFRSVLKRVRTELAERYVADLDYTITEISYLLGYADASAFSRAYRAWFGLSPNQARMQARQ
jgi:AraC-like DNA-binding protein